MLRFYTYIVFVLINVEIFSQSAGFNNTFIVLSLNSGGNSFYDLNATTGNPDFHASNLGSFTQCSSSLVLKGAQHNVWKCGGCDLTSTRLYYRIYPQGSPSGSYTSISIGYSSGGANGCGGQDQQWQNVGYTINLLSGLSPGSYTIEVYSDATITCLSGTAFANNSGNNYRANFTVVNEFGDFASAIKIRNCGASQFYNTSGLGADCINNDCSVQFQSRNFGSFNQNSGALRIVGGEIKTWKNTIADVTGARLYYTIYPTGSRPGSPVFSDFNLPFKCDCNTGTNTFNDGLGPCGARNQKWNTDDIGPNIFAAPIDLTNRPVGNYTLEIYYQYTGTNNGF
jgi:hypothetical protein